MEPLKCHASSQLPVYAMRIGLGALFVTALVVTILSGLQVVPGGTYAASAALLVGFAVLGVFHACHQRKKEPLNRPLEKQTQEVSVQTDAPAQKQAQEASTQTDAPAQKEEPPPRVILGALPADCLDCVLEYLAPKDVARFGQASKGCRSLVQSREKWTDRLTTAKLQAKAFQLWKKAKVECFASPIQSLAKVYAKEMVAELEKQLDAVERMPPGKHRTDALRHVCITVRQMASEATDQIIARLCPLVQQEPSLRGGRLLLTLFLNYPAHPSLLASISVFQDIRELHLLAQAFPNHQEALRILREASDADSLPFFSFFVEQYLTQDHKFMSALFQDLEDYVRKRPQPVAYLSDLSKMAVRLKRYETVIGWMREFKGGNRSNLVKELIVRASEFTPSQEDLEYLWSEMAPKEEDIGSYMRSWFVKKMVPPEKMLEYSQTDETKAVVALRKLPGDPEAAEALLKQIKDPLLTIKVLGGLAAAFKGSEPKKTWNFLMRALHLVEQLPVMDAEELPQQLMGLTHLIKAGLLNAEDRERHLACVLQRLPKSSSAHIVYAPKAYMAFDVDRACACIMERSDINVSTKISLFLGLSDLDKEMV